MSLKFQYDMDFVANATKLTNKEIEKLLKYFSTLPLMAKLEVFYQAQLIEEENEYIFFQHYFNKSKTAEYRFSLFVLSIKRLYDLENSDKTGSHLSSYKLKKIAKLKALKENKKT